MNQFKEKYPENIQDLLSHADALSTLITEKLNDSNCKTIADLYDEVNGKVTRNKKRFNELGYTANEVSAANKNNQFDEFKGLYIFGEETAGKIVPVYIGISRTVFRRLRQHGWGKNHNQCTLAYLKTKESWKAENRPITAETRLDEHMMPAKTKIQRYKVVLVPVAHDYDLYFLEVVLAGKFRTKWNSFRTH